MVTHRMPAHRRLAAWVVTGPLGHLYGGVVDIASALSGYWWARARNPACLRLSSRDAQRPPAGGMAEDRRASPD